MTKECRKCGVVKTKKDFYESKSCRDRLNPSCKSCCHKYRVAYQIKNRNKISEYNRIYLNKNRELVSKKNKQWRLKNINKWRESRRKYMVNYRKSNLKASISHRLRSRIYQSFAGSGWARGSSKDLIGVTFDVFKLYIESKFLPGMSWGNRGKWHIDHIIPLASAKTPEEMTALCKYTNLQPLWAIDNFKKRAKMPTHVVSSKPELVGA